MKKKQQQRNDVKTKQNKTKTRKRTPATRGLVSTADKAILCIPTKLSMLLDNNLGFLKNAISVNHRDHVVWSALIICAWMAA